MTKYSLLLVAVRILMHTHPIGMQLFVLALLQIKVRELDSNEAKGRPHYTKVHSPYLQRGKDKRGMRPASPEEPFVPYFP